jgi:hypothetical protein
VASGQGRLEVRRRRLQTETPGGIPPGAFYFAEGAAGGGGATGAAGITGTPAGGAGMLAGGLGIVCTGAPAPLFMMLRVPPVPEK